MQRFADRIQHLVPSDPPDRIIVSVSGGADSMFLLQLLAFMIRMGQLKSQLSVFHLNHMLRDQASADADLVLKAAAGLDIPVYLKEFQIGKFAARARLSLEEAGRLIRYRSLKRLAGGAACAVAHNANDYVETFLLHLCRNAGQQAFFSMPAFQELDGLTIWRPLLLFSAAEIREFCHCFNIEYARDQSNDSPEFKRNRLRKSVVPVLEREGLQPVTIWKNFHDEPALAPAGQKLAYIALDRRLFVGLSQRDLYWQMGLLFRRLGLNPMARGLLLELWRRLQAVQKIALSGGQSLLSAMPTGALWIFRKDAEVLRSPEFLIGPGECLVRYNEKTVQYRLAPGQAMRTWQPGMRYGRHKLKRIWNEWHVPEILRSKIPLLLGADGNVDRACLEFVPELSAVFSSMK